MYRNIFCHAIKVSYFNRFTFNCNYPSSEHRSLFKIFSLNRPHATKQSNVSQNNHVFTDTDIQIKQQSDHKTLKDDDSSIKCKNLSHSEKDKLINNSKFVGSSTNESKSMIILPEIKNASQLTIEHWKYLFKACNLDKAFLIDGKQPKHSYESVIQLKENTQPKIIISDSSSIDAHLTYTERGKTFVENKFDENGASLSSSFVSISSDYQRNEQTARNQAIKKLYTTCMWNFPRVSIELDNRNIEPTEEFLNEINKILSLPLENQYDQLKSLFLKYGHIIATKLTLGGQLYHTDMQEKTGTIDEIQHKEKQKQKFLVAISPNPTLELGTNTFICTKKEGQYENVEKYQMMNVTFQATGGNTTLCQNPNQWALTVEDFRNWRVIKIEKTLPIYKILNEDQQQKIEIILNLHQLKQNNLDNKSLQNNETNSSDHKIPQKTVSTLSLITGIEIVSHVCGTPDGYECLEEVYNDSSSKASLVGYPWLGLKERYLCIRRAPFLTDPGVPMLTDIILTNKYDTTLPSDYHILFRTKDKGEQATKKRFICVKMIPYEPGKSCICDIQLLNRPMKLHENYRWIGDINGLRMYIQQIIIPFRTEN